ncbi:MAG: methylmalonyl Co-A mutase-associated GTPase MeaB [Thermodesulfobacteriota bacterium]|nr:methylmalonyl Co-A mutase-associated GTPase MeaB [Thermodesulfobacteriota bacterium]
MNREKTDNIEDIVKKMLTRDRRAAARLITLIENGFEKQNEVMKLVYPHTGRSMIVGITGSGGSGKSTLIDHLITRFRQTDKTVGVVAVDPSSPFSGGALLGDRIRFQNHSLDDGVYIRSMGSRGYLGGLARATTDVVRIMEAMGNDLIIIETLGAGQDEIDIIHLAQTCLLVMTPGMGDDIQAMKAGIMEIADLIVLNKADLDGANMCLRALQTTIHCGLNKEKGAWTPQVIPTVAVGAKSEDIRGIDELIEAIMSHQAFLHKSRAIEEVRAKRIERELGLAFKDEIEKIVFAGLKGTGRKRDYIKAIQAGQNDPYSVVEEILGTFLKSPT